MNKYQFYRNNYPELDQGEINRKLWLHEMEQLETMKMMEQAKAMQSAQAAMASGAGGAGFLSLFYGYGILSSDIRKVWNSEVIEPLGEIIFPGLTVFAPVPEENSVYFVTRNNEAMNFGKFDFNGGGLTIIDEVNLGAIQVTEPGSLHYDGENFIFLSNFMFSPPEEPKITQITKGGVCTFLSDFDDSTFYPNAIFQYNGVWLCSCAFNGVIGALAPVNLATGSLEVEPIPLYITGSPYSNTKVWINLGISIVGGTIYANTYYSDKDTNDSHFAITTLDVDTGECVFQYSIDPIAPIGSIYHT